ncbi:hypothetical protein VNO77_05641 [Canavalia gladiata]|uniref:Uncharacterized protein n=1 Tax=Canavalia gladiata TaxID=3824 RepID=A0AAN9R8V5_CANGL
MNSSNLESRSLLDELSSFNKRGLFNLGHPLLNRIAESFAKAAGVCENAFMRERFKLRPVRHISQLLKIQLNLETALSRLFAASVACISHLPNEKPDRYWLDNTGGLPAVVPGAKRHCLPHLRGLVAGIYSGPTYGLKEARGAHDWKKQSSGGSNHWGNTCTMSEEAEPYPISSTLNQVSRSERKEKFSLGEKREVLARHRLRCWIS